MHPAATVHIWQKQQRPRGSQHVTCPQRFVFLLSQETFWGGNSPLRTSRRLQPRQLRVSTLLVSLLVKEAQAPTPAVKASQNWNLFATVPITVPQMCGSYGAADAADSDSLLFCSLPWWPSAHSLLEGVLAPKLRFLSSDSATTTNLPSGPLSSLLIPVSHTAQASFRPTCSEPSSFYLNMQGFSKTMPEGWGTPPPSRLPRP